MFIYHCIYSDDHVVPGVLVRKSICGTRPESGTPWATIESQISSFSFWVFKSKIRSIRRCTSANRTCGVTGPLFAPFWHIPALTHFVHQTCLLRNVIHSKDHNLGGTCIHVVPRSVNPRKGLASADTSHTERFMISFVSRPGMIVQDSRVGRVAVNQYLFVEVSTPFEPSHWPVSPSLFFEIYSHVLCARNI